MFQRSPDLLTDLNTEAWHVLFSSSYSWDRELAGRRLGQVGAKPVTMCPSNASMTFVCVRVCARVCLQVGIFFFSSSFLGVGSVGEVSLLRLVLGLWSTS